MTIKSQELLQKTAKAAGMGDISQCPPNVCLHGERLNIYTCEMCLGHIVTVDKISGTTPFMVQCRATEGCGGMMQSSMYKVFDQRMKPDFVWDFPSDTAHLTPGELEHVEKGGLLLYPYED